MPKRKRETGRNAQIVRILKILKDLETVSGVTLYELSDRYGATTRTIRRDIDALGEAGVPIERDPSPDEKMGKWRIATRKHGDALKSLLDTSHYLALRFAMGQGGVVKQADGFFDRLTELADKIAAALGAKGRKELDAIEKAVHSYEKFLYTAAPVDVFVSLVWAIVDHKVCRVVYQTPGSEAPPKSYEVLPLKMFAHNGTPYVLVHVAKHDKVILLNLQRLRELKVTKVTRDPPANFDPGKWEHAAFSVYAGTVETTYRMRFTPEVASIIQERSWHQSQKFTPVRGGGVELEFTCTASYEVTAWVASWRDKVEVLAPESLKEELAEIGAWMVQKYGPPPTAPAPPPPPPARGKRRATAR